MANIVELRGMSKEKLSDMLEEKRKEMFNLRFRRASGQLEDYTQLKVARHEIAQIETVLHMRKLAIEAALKTPEIATLISEHDEWDATAHFDYESSEWLVEFMDAKGSSIASATVNLNKKQPKSRRDAAGKGQSQVVTSYEVTG